MKKTLNYRKFYELWITAPSFLWLILFFLIPTLIVATFSIRVPEPDGGLGKGWSFGTLDILLEPKIILLFIRTLVLSLTATMSSILIAIPVAYTMARSSKRIQHLLLLLVIVPFWSSFLVRIFAWKSLLHPDGLLKQALVFFHVIDESTTLLYNDFAVISVMMYTYIPFAILPLYASFSKFNFQLFEAAYDLGATKTQAFFKIFIPNIKWSLISAASMVFIPCIGAYVIPDLVGGTSAEMVGNKIAQKLFYDRNVPDASVLSTALTLLILLPALAWTVVKPFSGSRGAQ